MIVDRRREKERHGREELALYYRASALFIVATKGEHFRYDLTPFNGLTELKFYENILLAETRFSFCKFPVLRVCRSIYDHYVLSVR